MRQVVAEQESSDRPDDIAVVACDFNATMVQDFLFAWYGTTVSQQDAAGLAAASSRVSVSLDTVDQRGASAAPARQPLATPPISTPSRQGVGEALCELSLIEVADAIRRRSVSVEEVVRACIARASRLQGAFNIFIEVEDERALAEARRADEALSRGHEVGPLHGVPVAHKDTFAHRGRIPTCGSLLPFIASSDETATVLRRLEGAGAIDIGGLNTSDCGLNPFGLNRLAGLARNPWNGAHITGGSSSGSAAAVAAGLVFGSLGSDTGGSIRIPAALCGVVGMKPTDGRLSRHGIFPLSKSLDTPGPLARTVADCARLMTAMAGYDPADPASRHEAVPDYESNLGREIAGLRIGVLRSRCSAGLDSESDTAVTRSLGVFRALGAEIIEIEVPDIELMDDVTNVIAMAEGACFHAPWLTRHRDAYTRVTRNALEFGLAVPAARYLAAVEFRAQAMQALVPALFTKVDAIHTPTVPTTAPTIEAVLDILSRSDNLPFSLGCHTKPVNFLGLPAVSIPCGYSLAGMPVGFQLIGRPFSEALLLNLGHAYQSVTDFHKRFPPVGGG